MGTGSGILSEAAKNCGVKEKGILAVDIDKESVEYVKKKGFNAIESDLFSKLKGKKFDIISFNAPYLPADKYDKKSNAKAIAGGKKGDEISVRFLSEAKEHLNAGGKIFLLISSMTPRNKIDAFSPKEVARMKLEMFEELVILEFD
jgi:release factor glutamine methyltransferase